MVATPSPNAQGLPRTHEPRDLTKIPEPASVTWIMEYTGGGCTCMHPTKVTEQPSGRVQEYTFDQSRGLLLTETIHDPAAPPSGTGADAKVTYTYQYETGWETTPPRYSLLKKIIQPDGSTVEFDHVFDTQATRLDPNHGFKLLSTTSKSELIGNTYRITETEHFDGFGRVYKHIDPEGTDTRRFYDATQYGQYFVHREIVGYQQGTTATETRFEFDDLGRLYQRRSDFGTTAETHTTWARNPLGLPTRITTQRDSFQEETLLSYDVWDNAAVARTRNLDSAGQPQKGPSGTATGRDWIRREWQWESFRLLAKLVDRRPLHEPEDLANPLGGTNPWLQRTIYLHNAMGDLTSTHLPNGSFVSVVWDGYRTPYIVKVTDPNAVEHEQARYYIDGALRVKAKKRMVGDGAGGTTTLQYDVVRNHAGAVREAHIPEVNKPQGYNVDVGGQELRFTHRYDGSLLTTELLSKADVQVGKRTLVRDEAGRVVEVRDEVLGGQGGELPQRKVLYELNKRSQTTLITNHATGRKARYVYDTKGRLERVDDGLASNNLVSTVLAYLSGTDYVASKERSAQRGVLTGTATTKTYRAEYTYGKAGVLTKVRDKGDTGTTTSWRDLDRFVDSLRQIDKQVDAMGRVHQTYFDAAGRAVAHVRRGTTPSRDLTTSATYSDSPGLGGQTSVDRIDAKGFVTRVTFDALGRRIALQRPGANLSDPPSASSKHKAHAYWFEFDAGNRQIHAYDGRGIQVDFFFDALDQLLVRQSPNMATYAGEVSQLTVRDVLQRDDFGRIAANATYLGALGATMTLNNAQTRVLDSLGRVRSESFLYQGGGATPATVQRTYTNLDDRTKLTYADGLDLDHGFDSALGRLSSMNLKLAGSGQSSRLLAEYAHFGPGVNQRRLHYSATTNGLTSFDFDHYGRGAQIKDEIGSTVLAQLDFEHDLLDNLVKESYRRPSTPSGWTTGGDRFFYDEFNRLTEAWLGLDGAGMSANPLTPSNNFKDRTVYALDQGANRSSLDFLSSSENYVRTYSLEDQGGQDVSNRYDAMIQAGITTPVEHDAAGNLRRIGDRYFVFDIFNRLSEVYTAAEGAQQQSQSSPGTKQVAPLSKLDFEYARRKIWEQVDGPEKLLRYSRSLQQQGKLRYSLNVAPKSSSNSSSQLVTLSLVALYAYDPYDRRVVRLVYDGIGGTETYFHTYEGWRELQELKLSGSSLVPTKSFVWGSRLDELLAYIVPNGSGHTSYFVHQSGADSTHVVVDEQGVEVERVEYRASGVPDVFTKSGSTWTYYGNVSSVGLPYAWHGKRHDPESGLVYNRHRYFSPEMGRFVSVDAIGAWGDELNHGNGYGFAGSNALSRVDPFGLQGVGSSGLGARNPKIDLYVPPRPTNYITAWIGGAGDAKTQNVLNLMRDRKGEGHHKYFEWDQGTNARVWVNSQMDPWTTNVVTVIGHSYGGTTAMAIITSVTGKDRVTNLVTLDPVHKPIPQGVCMPVKPTKWVNVYQELTPLDYVTAVPILGNLFAALIAFPGILVGNTGPDALATSGGQLGHESEANINSPSQHGHENSGGYLDEALRCLPGLTAAGVIRK
ncbi:MAG: RHS repeat-associated core domain-containing protein [Planctomycetes bacterium]|nr:RHS repeat-associated core domain-containing protein [Planctomycetota bacterium]